MAASSTLQMLSLCSRSFAIGGSDGSDRGVCEVGAAASERGCYVNQKAVWQLAATEACRALQQEVRMPGRMD